VDCWLLVEELLHLPPEPPWPVADEVLELDPANGLTRLSKAEWKTTAVAAIERTKRLFQCEPKAFGLPGISGVL